MENGLLHQAFFGAIILYYIAVVSLTYKIGLFFVSSLGKICSKII